MAANTEAVSPRGQFQVRKWEVMLYIILVGLEIQVDEVKMSLYMLNSSTVTFLSDGQPIGALFPHEYRGIQM
jgi:hypothetical protein